MKKICSRNLGLLAVLALAACGGGGDGDPTPPPPATVTLSGVVIDGPIRGATVCLDLNGDGACGSGEPASAPTDAAGNYTIAGVTEEQAASGAAFVAMVPADAIDADNPGVPIGTAYTMRAPAGKGTLISPITTMIQAGVARGLTLAVAEQAVAGQLQVGVANLYRNYSAEPNAEGSSALAVAATGFIVPALKSGSPIDVAAPVTTPTPTYAVADFMYVDATNWYLRYMAADRVTGSDGLYPYYDRRIQYVGGEPVPAETIYAIAAQPIRLTAQGWTKCDGTTEHRTSLGSPYSGIFCGDRSYNTRTEEDISGKSIAEVVAVIRAGANDVTNTLRGNIVPAQFGTAVFPAGSVLTRRSMQVHEYAVRYLEADGFLDMTVAQLIVQRPIPASPTGTNTVSMGTLRDANGNIVKRPRVAFGPGGLAQYYLCDLVEGISVNCAPSSTGTYTLTTLHGAAVITFTNQPTENDPYATSDRILVERDGRTWYGNRPKPDKTAETAARLNHSAFTAVAALLGIVAPAP